MTVYTRPFKVETSYRSFNGVNYESRVRRQDLRRVTSPMGQEPAPYTTRGVQVTSVSGGHNRTALPASNASAYTIASGNSTSSYFVAANAQALNSAYERFKSSVSDMASLGETLAERRQAVQMISSRALQLVGGYRDLRRGDLRSFLDRFGIFHRRHKRHRRNLWTRPKEASGLWLEYHFGWSPLLGDIYKGCELLQSPFSSAGYPVYGSGWGRYENSTRKWGGPPFNATSFHATRDKGVVHYKQLARVRVDNPNLHRATTLGLTNPVALAWELIPFSFLVDWFLPVGNFLNSWSDFLGLAFSEVQNTRYIRADSTVMNNSLGIPSNASFNSWTLSQSFSAWGVRRELRLIKPVIYPKQYKGISVTRAATSVSLLLQVFKPGSK